MILKIICSMQCIISVVAIQLLEYTIPPPPPPLCDCDDDNDDSFLISRWNCFGFPATHRLTQYPITVAWVIRPERLRGAQDEVKQAPKGHQLEVGAQWTPRLLVVLYSLPTFGWGFRTGKQNSFYSLSIRCGLVCGHKYIQVLPQPPMLTTCWQWRRWSW